MNAPNEPQLMNAQSAWSRKLLRFARANEVTSIEGYLREKRPGGTVFKRDPSSGGGGAAGGDTRPRWQ